MGSWLSKCVPLPGSSKPVNGYYDMLTDKLAVMENGQPMGFGLDEATSEMGAMVAHVKGRIKLLYSLKDFHNARMLLDTDVADTLIDISGTIGGLDDENKMVRDFLETLCDETRKQAVQHVHFARTWGEQAIKAIDHQIGLLEEFLHKELCTTLGQSQKPGSTLTEKGGGPHDQKLIALRESRQRLEDLQIKFFRDYLSEYCHTLGVGNVHDNSVLQSIGEVKAAVDTLIDAPAQEEAPDPELDFEFIEAPSLDSTGDEGSLGDQTRNLPLRPPEDSVTDELDVLFYVKALYDYSATIPDEFNFKAGDVIAVTEVEKSGWWIGHLLGSKVEGRQIFPSNYTVVVQL